MERFLYKKPDNKEPKINVWYSYPAIEAFAMASLGYLSIFKDLDCDRELYVERIYTDTHRTLINKENVDCMGFSVCFEIDILNIIKLLKKYDIPLKSSDRDENSPIIFAGGIVLMSNPKPFEDFFDFICIGEKVALKGAFEVLKNKKNYTRDELLKKLSELEGIYVPKYKKEVKILRDSIAEPLYTPILSEKSFFKDTFVIELERGCPKMCNFCLASWLNTPIRFADYDKIIEAIDFGLKYTNKIALLGAYVAGHPKFNDIIEYIAKKCENMPIELSISSLRADLADIELIKTLVKCNQKSATIAVEAGSERLREFIGKNLKEEEILKTVETSILGGLKGLKMYFMLGLPTESEEDISEIVELAKKIKAVIKKYKVAFEVVFSASTYIPKAHTPFENAKRCDKKVLEKRINYLKKNLHKLGVQFRSPSIDWDIIQSILSKYPESLFKLLVEAVEEGGNLGAFKQVWRKHYKKGLLPSFEDCAKDPLNNIKTQKLWDFIVSDAQALKNKKERELVSYLE